LVEGDLISKLCESRMPKRNTMSLSIHVKNLPDSCQYGGLPQEFSVSKQAGISRISNSYKK